MKAVTGIGRCISDINLGVNYWVWFLGYEEFDQNDNSTRILGYLHTTGEFSPFLKYYYFRKFARTLDPGAQVRFCSARYSAEDRNTARNSNMENWYGQKPPICACAAKNTDGEWGFAVVNQTGISSDWAGSIYYPSSLYEVTFDVEELRDEPPLSLELWRASNTDRDNDINERVDIVDGKFTVTLRPTEMVVLRNSFDTRFQPLLRYEPETDYGPCGMGFGLALLPPIGAAGMSWYSRRRKKI